MSDSIIERIRSLRKSLKLTQSEFANGIGVSRGVIENIELGRVAPKPLLIQQICKEYNVSRVWLETGEGDMFEGVGRDEEIALFLGEVLAGEDDSFVKRLIRAISRMSADELDALDSLLDKLLEEQKNKKDE